MRITGISTWAAMVVVCAASVATRTASAATDACLKSADAARILEVSRYVPPSPSATKAADETAAPAHSADRPAGTTAERQRDDVVALGDVIQVKVANLAGFYQQCSGRVVLFLDGYPFKSLTPSPPSDPNGDTLLFRLNVGEGWRSAQGDQQSPWANVLGQPDFSSRTVVVSVGPEDGYAVKSDTPQQTTLRFIVLANRWLALWGVIFLGMAVAFYVLARNTNIVRDGNPTPVAALPGAPAVPREQFGPYSLSKTQGAFWFFVILAAYLFIGIVTGDFRHALNSTALILLGLGAGTVVASTLIDKSKDVRDAPTTQTESVLVQAKLVQIEQQIAAKRAQIEAQAKTSAPSPPPTQTSPAPPSTPVLAGLTQEYKALVIARDKTLSEYRKLTQQNENFLTDILSDADGIGFHRFQMAAWTLVLGVIFVKEVYESLVMPTFDATTLGLLGLSAGTYLGLKIPEATTSKD